MESSDLTSAIVVISATGDIDASNAGDLAVVTWLRLGRGSSLILDLSGVDFFGSDGFWVVRSINEHCIASGSHLALVCSAAVARLLDVCDRDRTLRYHRDIDTALLADPCHYDPTSKMVTTTPTLRWG